jgi:hypothetical protein
MDEDDDDLFASLDEPEPLPEAAQMFGLVVPEPIRSPGELNEREFEFRMSPTRYAVMFDDGPEAATIEQY